MLSSFPVEAHILDPCCHTLPLHHHKAGNDGGGTLHRSLAIHLPWVSSTMRAGQRAVDLIVFVMKHLHMVLLQVVTFWLAGA